MDDLTPGGIICTAVVTLVCVALYLSTRLGHSSPNHVWGIRTPATLASQEAWDAGHRAAQPYVLGTAVVGLVGLVATVFALVTHRSFAVGTAWGGAGLQLVLLVVSAVAANRAARRYTPLP